MPAPRFSRDTLTFLRALKRNNRREWFNAHRDDYEAAVRRPMTAIVEQLAIDFREIAPELVASPKVSMYRIYRDTRFYSTLLGVFRQVLPLTRFLNKPLRKD